MPRAARLALGALLLASDGGPLLAQGSVPGVGAELVRLDVVVTDAHGKLIRGLTREDFELREDGKPQRLLHFVATEVAAPGTPTAAAVPSPAAGIPAPAAAAGRQIVLLVDDLHIAPGNIVHTQQALARVVDEFVAAEDELAVLTTSSGVAAIRFSRDRAPAKEAIARIQARQAFVAPAKGSQMTPAEAELILRGDIGALKLAARTLKDEPGTGFDGPRGAVAQTSGFTPAGIDPTEKAAAEEARRQARGILAEALQFSSVTLGRIDDVLRGLSTFPGRKLCLLVSDGFLVGAATTEERTRDMRRVIDAATRSGAVVYALDARGLASQVSDAGVRGTPAAVSAQGSVARQSEQLYRSTLETLANDTGGFLVRNTNDLAGGLVRMLEDNTAYYLMAYEPANTRRDGKFRRIELRLARHPRYVVRTRAGYYAADDRKRDANSERASAVAPLEPAAVAAPTEAEARAALDASVEPGGIPVRLTADYVRLPPDGDQVVIRAHVDLASVQWRHADDREQAAVDLIGGVYDSDGKAVGEAFGRRATLDLTPAEHKSALEAGLQHQHRMALPPGRYQVRVAVREAQPARAGGASSWIEVPDLANRKLALSSVFVSASAAQGPARPGAGADGDPRSQVLRRFRRGENLDFQLYVYNPVVDDRGERDLVLQAQVWANGKVLAASTPRPPAFQVKEGLPLPETNSIPLESLAPGSYELRVVVVDRKANATATQRLAFSVE